MSYKQGEADIATQIIALAAWTATNCLSLANDTDNKGATLLDTGADDRYCLLREGQFSAEHDSADNSFRVFHRETIIELSVLVKGDGPSPENIMTDLTQDIVDRLDAHYKAGGMTIAYGKVTRGTRIENDTTANEMPFVFRELTFEWEEESTVTQAD